MVAGDEVDALSAALVALGGVDVDEVLADQPGRRRVVRVGDVVVKAFSSAEQVAWRREVAGLHVVGASADPGLAVELVGWDRSPPRSPPPRPGRKDLVALPTPRWVATRWVDGVVPAMATDLASADVHAALGPWLARLHAIPPVGQWRWPVVDRLRALLEQPPQACPAALVADVRELTDPLIGLVVDGTFVHGDWGTANVLVDADGGIVTIIDFEDAHAGDPAEDFAWQVLAGIESDQFAPMAAAYRAAGADLGADAVERLVVCGAHLCLEVAGWGIAGHTERCLATLDELVTGRWPDWPDWPSA